MFIGVIPAEPEPIFLIKCPHARLVGLVRIAWTELRFVCSAEPASTDAELHSNCREGVRCGCYPVNREDVLRAIDECVRRKVAQPFSTLDGKTSLEMELLDPRRTVADQSSAGATDQHRRIALPH